MGSWMDARYQNQPVAGWVLAAFALVVIFALLYNLVVACMYRVVYGAVVGAGTNGGMGPTQFAPQFGAPTAFYPRVGMISAGPGGSRRLAYSDETLLPKGASIQEIDSLS